MPSLPPIVISNTNIRSVWGNAVVNVLRSTIVGLATRAGQVPYSTGRNAVAVLNPPATGSGLLTMRADGTPLYTSLPLSLTNLDKTVHDQLATPKQVFVISSAILPAAEAFGSTLLQIIFKSSKGAVYSPTLSFSTTDVTLDRGISVIGERIFILDESKVLAYSILGTRVATEDLTLHSDNANGNGVAVTATRIYVVDRGAISKVYVYDRSSGARVSAEEFTFSGMPWDISVVGDKVYILIGDGNPSGYIQVHNRLTGRTGAENNIPLARRGGRGLSIVGNLAYVMSTLHQETPRVEVYNITTKREQTDQEFNLFKPINTIILTATSISVLGNLMFVSMTPFGQNTGVQVYTLQAPIDGGIHLYTSNGTAWVAAQSFTV